MEFMAALVKAPENCKFLKANGTHVTRGYWIYEGCEELLADESKHAKFLANACVPSLGGLSEQELITIAKERFGFDLSPKMLCSIGDHDFSTGPWVEIENGGTATCACGAEAFGYSLLQDW